MTMVPVMGGGLFPFTSTLGLPQFYPGFQMPGMYTPGGNPAWGRPFAKMPGAPFPLNVGVVGSPGLEDGGGLSDYSLQGITPSPYGDAQLPNPAFSPLQSRVHIEPPQQDQWLFGKQFNMSPVTLALMAAGGKMMEAGGWHEMPVTTGQAMGAGVQQGIGTYLGARGQFARENLWQEQLNQMRGVRESQVEERRMKMAEMERATALRGRYEAAVQSGDKAAVHGVLMEMYPETYFKSALDNPDNQLTEIGVDGDMHQIVLVSKGNGEVIAKIGQPYKKGPLATASASVGAEKPFWNQFGKTLGEDFTSRRGMAQEAAQSIVVNNEGLKLIDKGIISGAGANWKIAFGKALQTAGFSVADDAVANTEAYVSNMAQNVGKMIKMFGSGTGLSNADREYAEKMAAGSITLNEESLKKILTINNKASRNVLRRFNKDAKSVKSHPEAQGIPLELEVEEPEEMPWEKYQ